MIRRMLRALLHLAPRPFRERHGDDLLAVHEDRARVSSGGLLGVLFGVKEVLGMAGLVMRLRLGFAAGTLARTMTRRGGASMLETTFQDMKFGVRTLGRNAGFAATAVIVIALGVAATTAIFSAVNASFLRPLPFADADRLVMIYETNPEFGWVDATAAPSNALDWRDQVEAFEGVTGYADFPEGVTYLAGEEPEVLVSSTVLGNFFSVLGVRAELGRTFRYEETWEGDDGVVVLSHELWTSHFGADPEVVGTRIELDDELVEVIGVMPEGFQYPSAETQLWAPVGWPSTAREQVRFRRAHFVRTVARVRSDVSLAEADAQLQVVVERLQEDYPETNSVMGAGMMPLRDFLIKDTKTPLLVLFGAVTLLLLLACTNVANLMLVRAGERGREVAVRQALGAGKGRVIRQFFTESLLLAVGGGALGLWLGWMGVRALDAMRPTGIDGATGLALDHRVVLFTLAVVVVTSILSGLGPALRSVGGVSNESLKDGGRGVSVGRRGVRATNALVAVEVALALTLVVGAGLLVRSFWLLQRVDLGFQTDGVMAVQLSVPEARYQDRASVLEFWDRLEETLEGRPGIERAGLIGRLPLDGTSWSSSVKAEDWSPDRVGYQILHRRADAGYFETLGIPLIRGRMFEPTDEAGGPLVVLINETFARVHFPDEDPLGKRIVYNEFPSENSNWFEIVGIVGDQQQVSPAQPAHAEVFENRDQDWGRVAWIVMKTSADPAGVLPTVRSVLREMDPMIPIRAVRPLETARRESIASERYMLTLLGVFGIVALVLSTVGVYGVTAQAARKRTHEIGIRMAMGATGSDVVGLMVRHTGTLMMVGLLSGVGLSLLASRALASLLFGVVPGDPLTLVSVAALLGFVGLAACYIPARRAAAVDPVSSLRPE